MKGEIYDAIELATVLNIKMITEIWLDIFVPATWLIQTKFKPGGDNLTLQKKSYLVGSLNDDKIIEIQYET